MNADNLLDELMKMDQKALIAFAEAEANRMGGFKKTTPNSELLMGFDSVGTSSDGGIVYIRVNTTASVDDYHRFAAAVIELTKGDQELPTSAFYFSDQKFVNSYSGPFAACSAHSAVISLEICLQQSKKRGADAS